jgi:hypothetical protein
VGEISTRKKFGFGVFDVATSGILINNTPLVIVFERWVGQELEEVRYVGKWLEDMAISLSGTFML